jgi:hypothetical protein
MAMSYAKGTGPVSATYARGGPEMNTRSRFIKTPDVFRTSIEQQDYDKTGKGGELSKIEGDTKSQPVIKPRT